MADATVWVILVGIYFLAVGGCLCGLLAVGLNCAVTFRLRQTQWMGYGAIGIGLLLLIGWVATGERFSYWILVPIVSLGSGMTAVIQYRRRRSSRRRSSRSLYRVKHRRPPHRLRLVT